LTEYGQALVTDWRSACGDTAQQTGAVAYAVIPILVCFFYQGGFHGFMPRADGESGRIERIAERLASPAGIAHDNPMMKYAKLFQVQPGGKIDLSRIDPDLTGEASPAAQAGKAGADQ
jgi:hypothetical protein